jgi:hypothetical protein
VKVAAAVVVAAALVLPAAQAAERKAMPSVLGLDYAQPGLVRLAWFDPLTLRMLPRPAAQVGRYVGRWSFSPDRSVLAIAAADTLDARGTADFKLRFVSVGEMRGVDEVDLGNGSADSVTWLRPDRLLALVSGEPPRIAVVDPSRHVLLRSVPLPRYPDQVERLPDRLALLLGSSGSFAPAVLAVVDADGALRTVTLDRISIGTVGFEGRSPGFAVDRAGMRAFVVGADFTVAEVNLDTLGVKYHGVSKRALAKYLAGSVRQALWLGNGFLAVSGEDRSPTAEHPAGLRLVDTRRWSTRVVDRWIDHVERVPATAIFEAWSSSAAPWRVDVYGRGGTRRYRMDISGRQFNVEGPYGYVCADTDGSVMRIVNAGSGRTLRVPARPRPFCPYLLYGQSD